MANTNVELIGETDSIFSLAETCERCGLRAELIIEMVEYGIVAPIASTQKRWQFTSSALVRLQRAQRLRRDLDLNLSGLALSLELLDEIDLLKHEVAVLKNRLQTLHD